MNEKEIPKALKLYRGSFEKNYGRVYCPNCDELLPVGRGKFQNCPFCEQKLDWNLPKQ